MHPVTCILPKLRHDKTCYAYALTVVCLHQLRTCSTGYLDAVLLNAISWQYLLAAVLPAG